jgi:hypothetical protein
VDVVVISAEVEDKELIRVQLRNISIQLQENATLEDVIWELSDLFPSVSHSIQ